MNTDDINGSSGAEFNPLLPVDFGLWKLAPPVLGLLGLGVYAGYRKQMHSDAVEAQALRQPGAHVPINAYRVATRALMYGSVLSIGCTSAGVLAVGYFMGVRNVQEFSDKMRAWAPQQMHKLGFRHTPDYIRDRKATRTMTPDEEWEYIGSLMNKDEARAARENEEADREREEQRIIRAREKRHMERIEEAARRRQQQ